MTRLSVVIAAVHSEEDLAKCLVSLNASARASGIAPDCLEFVVITHSKDGTEKINPQLMDYPVNYDQVPSEERSAAWNFGARVSEGDILMFCDGSDQVAEQSIALHLDPRREFNTVVFEPVLLPFEVVAPGIPQIPLGFAGAVISIQRAVFLSIGGFSERFLCREELGLSLAVDQHGFENHFLPAGSTVRRTSSFICKSQQMAGEVGMMDARWLRLHPATVYRLPLGRFNDLGMRGLLLRRLLLQFPLLGQALSVLAGFLGLIRPGSSLLWFFFTLSYWLGVQSELGEDPLWQKLIYSPIILMYHAVGSEGKHASRYILPVSRFAHQMSLLKRSGHCVISLESLLAYRARNELPPARSVVITFDDGYRDNLVLAGPVLAQYRFPAAIFVVPGKMDASNDWDAGDELQDRPLLSWDAINDASFDFMQFGSHSFLHRPLTNLSECQLAHDLTHSLHSLAAKTKTPIPVLAYPYGLYNHSVISASQTAGYAAAVCSHPGPCDPVISRYELRRLEVTGNISTLDFFLEVSLGKTKVIQRLVDAR